MALDSSPEPSESGGMLDFSGGDGVPADGTMPLSEMQAIMESAGGEPAPSDPAAPAPAPAAAADPAAPGEPAKPGEAAKPPETAPAAEAKPPEPAAVPEEVKAQIEKDKAELATERASLRKGFSDLTRKQEALVKKTAEANAAIESAKADRDDAAAFRAIPDKVKADPIGFLESLGISKDRLLDSVIESEEPPAEREIKRLRAEITAKEKAAEEARAKAEQDKAIAEERRILTEWQTRNTHFADGKAEYDLINTFELGEAVHATVVAYHAQHNVILDPKVAADHLEARLRKAAGNSKTLKELFAAASPPAATPPAPAKAPAAATTAPQTAPSGNPTTAPKNTGPTTLAAVGSADSPPSSGSLPSDPNDGDDRFAAVVEGMARAGEFPEGWRAFNAQ